MSACVYQWGEAIGLQWYNRGPIIFLGPDGLTTHRYSLPADAAILLQTGNSSLDTKSYEDGYEDAVTDMERLVRGLR